MMNLPSLSSWVAQRLSQPHGSPSGNFAAFWPVQLLVAIFEPLGGAMAGAHPAVRRPIASPRNFRRVCATPLYSFMDGSSRSGDYDSLRTWGQAAAGAEQIE